jgi:hypothetical protein
VTFPQLGKHSGIAVIAGMFQLNDANPLGSVQKSGFEA